jgi:hypothetical protein
MKADYNMYQIKYFSFSIAATLDGLTTQRVKTTQSNKTATTTTTGTTTPTTGTTTTTPTTTSKAPTKITLTTTTTFVPTTSSTTTTSSTSKIYLKKDQENYKNHCRLLQGCTIKDGPKEISYSVKLIIAVIGGLIFDL